MVDYLQSSQLCLWTYGAPEHLTWLRARANHRARQALVADNTNTPPPQADARGWERRFQVGQEGKAADYEAYATTGPMENARGKAFLTAAEEETLVQFYAPKVATLLGPQAALSKCKRNSKVPATAVLLYRRFFLSNSVHHYDPKAIMVAAAFLAAKAEDASIHLNYLEQGTHELNAPVPPEDILAAECDLLPGVAFDLVCFHPFKAVLALTEDLRVYLKSDKGRALQNDGGNSTTTTASGQDLNPLYLQARKTLEVALLYTDLALLYPPAQLALASLVVAQDLLHDKAVESSSSTDTSTGMVEENTAADATSNSNNNKSSTAAPKVTSTLAIDWETYLRQRFDATPEKATKTWEAVQALRPQLRKGPPPTDWAALKSIHKKLKRVRTWDNKKRKAETAGGGNKEDLAESAERPPKRAKSV